MVPVLSFLAGQWIDERKTTAIHPINFSGLVECDVD